MMDADDGARQIPVWEQVAFRSAAEIRNHPGFQDAHDCLIDALLSLYGNDRRLIRGLMEYVRAVSFMVIVCIDAGYDPEDPSTYATMARLREVLGKMGISDDRRLTDIVNGLEMDGFLNREISPTDRRAHLLRPTEKMLATDREWLAAFHAPLAVLYPDEPTYRAAVAHDPAYQTAYRRVSLSTVGFAEKIISGNPIFAFFLGQHVGSRVLMSLASAVRGKTPPRTPPGFYTTAADQSAVSRTYVRNLMEAAAERGFVKLSSPAGRFVEMRPVLQEALSKWIADSLSGVDLVATLAKVEFGTAAGTTR
jgi:hypothetical protein